MTMKKKLKLFARGLKGIAWSLDHWVWVLAISCIISPISPHVRIPYALSYAQCDYIGTRGIVSKAGGDCSLIEIIDTRGYTTRWRL